MTYEQTPKQKAEQLVEEFKKEFIEYGISFNISLLFAKKQALICVAEIIDIAHFGTIAYSNFADSTIVEYTERVYWQEVKQHIEMI